MWQEQYKKTFAGTQVVLALVTVIVFSRTHLWTVALAFLVVTQISAVLGAIWAARIKRASFSGHVAAPGHRLGSDATDRRS
jgi:hypothetical protein